MYSDFGIKKTFVTFVETKKQFYFKTRANELKSKNDQKRIHCILFLGAKLPIYQLKCRAFPYFANA